MRSVKKAGGFAKLTSRAIDSTVSASKRNALIEAPHLSQATQVDQEALNALALVQEVSRGAYAGVVKSPSYCQMLSIQYQARSIYVGPLPNCLCLGLRLKPRI